MPANLSFEQAAAVPVSDLDALRALIEAGSVTPAIDRVIALDQIPDAMRDLTLGCVRGKVIIAHEPASR